MQYFIDDHNEEEEEEEEGRFPVVIATCVVILGVFAVGVKVALIIAYHKAYRGENVYTNILYFL